MLLDSNILIYATHPEQTQLREFIRHTSPVVSVISYIEVFGYHALRDVERDLLEQLFRVTEVLPLSESVVNQAVALRQQKRMSLGDSIIAATALVHGHTLVTHNTADFEWVEGIQLLDPFSQT